MNNALKSLIRQHYIDLQGYVSAGMEMNKSADKLFMNANENPYELPGLEELNRYPEPQPAALREAYAGAYGVEADWVIMTRGADEAIVILTKLFCEPHKDAILICPPTFGMYGVNASSMPAQRFEVPLLKEQGSFTLDKDEIINQAKDNSKNIKLVYICSPNNPTGTSLSHETIFEICEELEGHAIVLLDETYAEFSEQGSMCDDLEALPNLIILRTLSKSYALAGMRMGCFISADNDFTQLVRSKCLDAYPLPRLSIEAAFHVLSPEISAIAKENIQTLIQERKRVETCLKDNKHITHIYPSDANFLLIEMEKAHEFWQYAQKHNIILRDFSSKIGTENCIRISISMPEDNDKVLALFESFNA